MRSSMLALAAAAICAAAPLAASAQGRNAPPAEQREIAWRGATPACDDSRVLAEITARFAHREGGFWNSALRISGYDKVRETASRPWGASYIPRRFCTGFAHVEGMARPRRVDFVIIEGMGPIGLGWGVQYCVSGVERHLHAAPDCRMMRP